MDKKTTTTHNVEKNEREKVETYLIPPLLLPTQMIYEVCLFHGKAAFNNNPSISFNDTNILTALVMRTPATAINNNC